MNKEYYLKKADENLPQIFEKTIVPQTESHTVTSGAEFVIDLGNHYVGYFSFKMSYVDIYIDAPVRLKVRFCETERELYDDFDAYKGGLCRSWLQEEIINVDFPGFFTMPRRYAARYIKITVLNTPRKTLLSDFSFKAVTSADTDKLKPASISDPLLARIDKVAVNTLKNCMQRVFEDGPKRDRRLWTGDLRLEALANYYTFDNLALVRRCLYLFAAADNKDGIIHGYVYDYPEFFSGSYWFPADYSLLYVCTLCNYYNFTGDGDTFADLYSVAKMTMDAVYGMLDENGIATVTAKGMSPFIDWCPGLNKAAAFHGVYLYTLDLLVKTLEKQDAPDIVIYKERLEEGRRAAHTHLYNKGNGNFASTYTNGQNSVHSTVWMLLGGVIGGDEASDVLHKVLGTPDSIKPFTPYMHHYTVEALMKIGLKDEAREYIKHIWGGMIELGADTFYEVYVPGDPEFSPYRDRMVNSMCHAWSCTPAYFIRKYNL